MPYPKKFQIWQFGQGFSLIELLTVISIIAILVAAATISYSNAQQKSRDAKRKSDLKSVQQALEVFYQENSTYPQGDTNGQIRCESGAMSVSWGGNFSCGSKTYVNPLPKDPKGTETFQYYYESYPSNNNASIYTKYTLMAKLENVNDPEYCTSACTALPCTPKLDRSYCVIQP